MRKYVKEGPSRFDIRQAVALTVAAVVLLACTLVETIEIEKDGSGTTRAELFLEPSEVQAVDDVRGGIQENLKKDPKMRLVAEGPREGGHFFLLERPFELVEELDDDDATYRWSVDGLPQVPLDDATTVPSFGSLFARRYRLDLTLGAQDYGPARATVHRLEVRMPAPIVETNGELAGGNRVIWDRLTSAGRGELYAVSQTRRIPGPAEVANWFVQRHRDRFFDDDGLVWLADGKVWAGGLEGGKARAIAAAEGFDRLSTGGHRGLLYRYDEWWMPSPQDVRVVDFGGSEPPRDVRMVTSPSLSPDGRLLAFGRVRDVAASRKSEPGYEGELEGLWSLDLETGEELLLAGALDLPKPRGRRQTAPPYRMVDPAKWRRDWVSWSADGKEIWLERWFMGYEIAVYVAKVGTTSWRAISCDGGFGFNIVAASQGRVVTNSNPESHAYFDVCDVGSGRSLARKNRDWAFLFRERALMDFAFSRDNRLVIAAAPFTEEGWPGEPAEIWVGDPRPQKLVEIPENVSAIRWHPRKELLLYGSSLVDVGAGTTRALDGEMAAPQWAKVTRDVFPSLAATRVLVMAGVWLVWAISVALTAGLGWLAVRAVVRQRSGRAESLRCERCGQAVAPRAKFCGSCGAPCAGEGAGQPLD